MFPGRPVGMVSKRLKVLLAAGDERTSALLACRLTDTRRPKYEVLTTNLGWTSLTTIFRERPDCVLVDGGLSDIDGLDVCRRASSDAGVPVLALGPQGDDDASARWAEAGACGYLPLPRSMAPTASQIDQYAQQIGATVFDPARARNRFLHDVNLRRLGAALDGPDGRAVVAGSSVPPGSLPSAWERRIGSGERWKDAAHRREGPWAHAVAWSPDGRVLATAAGEPSVTLWQGGGGDRQRRLDSGSQWLYCLSWAPDGSLLAGGAIDGSVPLWDARTGRLLRSLDGHDSSVLSVAWSPDGRTLASASLGPSIRLWDVASGVLKGTCRGHTDGVSAVAWSPDGRTLASASLDGTVRLWEPAARRPREQLRGPSSPLLGIAWSPDGQFVAGASASGAVVLWLANAAADAGPARILRGRTPKTAVGFSPHGRLLAARARTGAIGIWRSDTWEPVRRLRFRGEAERVVAETVWPAGFSFHPMSPLLAASGRSMKGVVVRSLEEVW